MNTLEFEQLVEDAEYIDYDYGEDAYVLSVHFQSCFYLWNSYKPEVRAAIQNCYQRYMELWGEHITWGFDPLKKWRQKSFNKLPTFQHVLEKLSDRDDAIEWYVADGGYKEHEIDLANKYVFSVLTSPAWQIQEAAQIRFRVPRHLYYEQESKQQLLDFNEYCMEQLNPWYAVSGMQAATPFGDSNIKFDLVNQARDYKGIFIEESWDRIRLPYGIRSFDWLTFINNSLAERVGGIQQLEASLKKAKLKYKKKSQGVLIQVTEAPELIPINQDVPNNYLKLNAILRPLRDGNYGSMGDATYADDNLQSFDTEVSDLWMRRFDHKCVWNDLTSTAKSRKPLVPIKLKSNEICPISGRYRYEEDYDFIRNHPKYFEQEDNAEGDYRSYIILNKGDLAPYYLKLDQHGNFIERLEIEWTLFEEFNYV